MEIVERDSIVDELIDEIVPEGLDWERLVVNYPLPALALAAVGGFFLGRRHGSEILAALSSFMAVRVAENFEQTLERGLR